ncbi:XRE family transcriptional regulator [Streptomyces sp. NRRL B-3648]|uniref:XRE family transcriptional regulator n=1 Tax=Streptomyces sp. NRRL B-3648 TaxID=1519493 RepID=UPI0006AFA46F|nr:XRE family transcriptional regulator [Streptomyces sp. NRRL B-3648]KOX11490.1 hypothetical protein ADL04_00895 [Streptomyces sp. NRRL B-3648]
MGRQRPLPQEARSVAEFVACMRQLKERSGLTYRQLEANAQRRGDVLARSTVADALRRDSLPRAEVVAAFVRACGRDEDPTAWLEARDRLATDEPSYGDDGVPPQDSGLPPGGEGPTLGHDRSKLAEGGPAHSDGDPPFDATREQSTKQKALTRIRSRPVLAFCVGTVLLLAAAGAWALLPGGTGDRDPAAHEAGATPGLAPSSAPVSTTGSDGPAPGPTRIRPALATGLCITEGHDRKGRYRSQVAVQRPCADATPPDVSLVPVGKTGSYYIQWRHPVYGDGCLTALGSGHVVEGLLEPWPWESCSADRTSQHFFFDPVDSSGDNAFRIHVVQNGMCLGINGADDRAVGAEIAQQRCTGARDQEFLVDAAG